MGNEYIIDKKKGSGTEPESQKWEMVIDDLHQAERGYLRAMQWAISKEMELLNEGTRPREEEIE